jgi:hypothetical protein
MATSEAAFRAIEALNAICRQREAKPVPAQNIAVTACWHCGGSGECNCSTCGVLKPSVVWAAGECVACKARRRRVQ